MFDDRHHQAVSAPRWLGLRDAFAEAVAPAAMAGGIRERACRGVVVLVLDLAWWRDWQAEALALLDGVEAARAARQRHARDREALVATYALHRLLLSMVLDCAPGDVGIHRDGKGCPRLPGDAWHTSLSHASGHAAFAVSRQGPVGIDLESIERVPDVASIEERVVHRDDAARLAGLQAHARGRALLDLWVAKEALLKAAGIGLECGMETFPLPAGGLVPLPDGASAGIDSSLHRVDAGPAWACAVACPPGLDVFLLPVRKLPQER